MYITKNIGNLEFKLKEEHDFSWLNEYGEAFTVFDKQTSGNICFGIKNKEEKLFLKYAGASTINYDGSVEDAVKYLKNSVKIYSEIEHQNLVKLLEAKEIGEGYLLIYKWAEGECLYEHMKYSKEEMYTNPNSPKYKFQRLNIDKKMYCLKTIFEFHIEAIKKGYIAVDFYDGSIMYDFQNHKLTICDIDMYRKGKFINEMGRLWGSSRLQAPEEFKKGEIIEESTNIFLMGAMAFEILGDARDKNIEKWVASEELFNVAKKAVNENKKERFSSIQEFYFAWNKALKK